MDKSRISFWYKTKPMIDDNVFGYDCEGGFHDDAPSSNYKGDWRDSLRKRPDGE